MKHKKSVTAVAKIMGVSVLGLQLAQAGKFVTVDSASDLAEEIRLLMDCWL